MDKQQLKRLALGQTLWPKVGLEEAMERLGFVQADPIRSPARAEDLILRHRVKDYSEGDLRKSYQAMAVEEDYLYAYGFMTEGISDLWHPKKGRKISAFDKKVLALATEMEEISTVKLEESLGAKTVRNWWGGQSRAVKLSLDELNYWGLVKVVRREGGQRVYTVREMNKHVMSVEERIRGLILAIVNILSPVTERKLTEATRHIRRALGPTASVVERMVTGGVLFREKIDGVSYILVTKDGPKETQRGVKILAPFDPVVWDRRRFEQIWGWDYKFEAYVPKEKRIRGYYAMPLLWDEEVIGWVNAKRNDNGLDVEVGFVDKRPKSKRFENEVEEEVERLRRFLG